MVLGVMSDGEKPMLVLGDVGALGNVFRLSEEELATVTVEIIELTGDASILMLNDVEALDVMLKSCAEELGETEGSTIELKVIEVALTLDADKLGCKELVAVVGLNKREPEKLAVEVDCTVGLDIDRNCEDVEVELAWTALELIVSADRLTSTDVGSMLEGVGTIELSVSKEEPSAEEVEKPTVDVEMSAAELESDTTLLDRSGVSTAELGVDEMSRVVLGIGETLTEELTAGGTSKVVLGKTVELDASRIVLGESSTSVAELGRNSVVTVELGRTRTPVVELDRSKTPTVDSSENEVLTVELD